MSEKMGRVVALIVLLGCLTPVAMAQGGRAEINGTVYDQTESALPDAMVTATNEATGVSRKTMSGPEGRFILPTLTPGTYTLRVALQGFQAETRRNLVVGVGQELTLDFTLPLASVAETVTVSSEAPVIEVTASRVGANITSTEIDNLPSQGRSAVSLMQTIPGLTPSLSPGSFEGGNFNANGRDITGNLFLVDGVYNNDERNGGSNAQARISLDTIAEFQVLTHQYTAEYGGFSGVIVNTVTRSGQNRVFGRGFYYFQDDKLTANDPFLKARGEELPDSGRKNYGFNLGGPIIRNKLFWFFNLERNVINQAVDLDFPAEAEPLAVDVNDTQRLRSLNTFSRIDYSTGAHNLSFRWTREATPSIGEDWETNRSTRDNIFIEKDAGDQIFNGNWTAFLGHRATNEFRLTHVREDVLQGNTQYFDNLEDLNFIELNGRDQFDIGSQNSHTDFAAGPRASHGSSRGRTSIISDDFTFIKDGLFGSHTFKAGASYSWVQVLPQIAGGNDNGTFTFLHNRPFDPADAFTYPARFSIRLGEIYFNLNDRRSGSYFQDKWQVSRQFTLNLGLRYDYQTLTPKTKTALAPRLGFAYDPTGSGRTIIRGGVGKFYEYILAGVDGVLQQQAVIGPSFMFDTGQDTSASRGVIPSHVCLQPGGNGGLAVISPACRALLTNIRNQINAGGFVNAEPTVDGDRRMGYLWTFSLGVQRELFRDIAVSLDYISNWGRDQVGLFDINEGPPGANGRATRLGVNVFDPDGTLIPASARSTNFQRVLQYQTREELDSDYNALELSLVKRYSHRWSGRFAYTLARARDTAGGIVGRRFTNDLNPREDFGLANIDNRHAVAFSFNVNPWRGLGTGAVFRYYSGYPINETIGLDVNGDRDNNERPVRGVHDLTRPILSPVDGSGRAIRNGIAGNSVALLDLRLQYVLKMESTQTLGFFWEIYNALNRVNLGNPTGNRNSALFMIPTTAGEMRTMQLGIRYAF